MATTVDDLMRSKFSSRTLDEKVKIISQGKPRPVINKYVDFNSKLLSINELYDKETWLTASEMLDSIICWPCLLFPETESVKCFVGIIADKKFYGNILKHKSSTYHINGLYQYHLFLKEKVPSSACIAEKEIDLKTIEERNNKILRRIIDAVCFLVASEASLVKVIGACSAFDTEVCIHVLMSLKNCDMSGVNQEAINITRKFPEIIKKIVKAISDVMKINLKKEIMSCACASLILSKHSRNSKLSLIVRYFYSGNVCERLIDIINTRDNELIKKYILEIISDYNISSKLISFSCDGGALTTENITDLLASLHKLSPSCTFVPCHFHDFNVVLEQRLSRLEGCELFFNVLNSMKIFFQSNSKLCENFNYFSKRNVLDLCKLKPNNVQFLRMLKLYRCSFKAFFSHVAENCEKMSKDEIAIVKGFQYILEEYQIVFMIEAFNRLFSKVAVLNDMLNCGSPEKAFDCNILGSVETALRKEKANGFENLWTIVINELIISCSQETFQSVGKKETDALLQLYLKAIDCIIEEINVRFKRVQNLEYLSILNCQAHNKLLVSDYQVKNIQQISGNFIDKEKIVTEMKILSKNGWIFGGKSAYEFMDIFTKIDLKDIFKNIYRLGEIILTLPCKPNSRPKCQSKLDVIDFWSFESNQPDEMNPLSFLYIEKDYLKQLKSQVDFYDQVIFKLQETNFDVSAMFENINAKVVKHETDFI